MKIELIIISLLYILIWINSIVVIKGLIENSLSTYDKLYLAAPVAISITILVFIKGG